MPPPSSVRWASLCSPTSRRSTFKTAKRCAALLRASWEVSGAVAARTPPQLRKGPRGGAARDRRRPRDRRHASRCPGTARQTQRRSTAAAERLARPLRFPADGLARHRSPLGDGRQNRVNASRVHCKCTARALRGPDFSGRLEASEARGDVRISHAPEPRVSPN